MERHKSSCSKLDRLYERYVNPQWLRLLDVLQMNVEYVRCQGAELFTADNRSRS